MCFFIAVTFAAPHRPPGNRGHDELSKETAMIKTREVLTRILIGAAILLFLTFLFARIAGNVLFQGVQRVFAIASARRPAPPSSRAPEKDEAAGRIR